MLLAGIEKLTEKRRVRLPEPFEFTNVLPA
jgi:hypothetical protein